MIEYPKMLYKCPGSVPHNDGISYEPLIVDSAEAEQAAINDGWHLVVEDAWAKSQAPVAQVESREELEKQATELGVKFDGRTTDALLKTRIDEALEKMIVSSVSSFLATVSLPPGALSSSHSSGDRSGKGSNPRTIS